MALAIAPQIAVSYLRQAWPFGAVPPEATADAAHEKQPRRIQVVAERSVCASVLGVCVANFSRLSRLVLDFRLGVTCIVWVGPGTIIWQRWDPTHARCASLLARPLGFDCKQLCLQHMGFATDEPPQACQELQRDQQRSCEMQRSSTINLIGNPCLEKCHRVSNMFGIASLQVRI